MTASTAQASPGAPPPSGSGSGSGSGPEPSGAAEPDGTKGGTPARSRRRLTPYWLLLPAGLWLAVFFVAPFFYQASTSVQSGSLEEGFRVTWHFANYTDALAVYGPHFVRSFLYAATATLLCLLVGYPLAYMIAFRAGRWRGVLLVMVIAPFFTSFLIRTLAWKTILSDAGPVVGVLKFVHVLDFTSQLGLTGDDRLLATPLAVVCGLTYNFLPFMILPLYSSLERIDQSLHEAARDLYAKPATVFRKVTFPLSLPGVVAGTLLTFIPASGDYINAQLLGSPNTQMVGNAIQKQFLNVLDYPAAAAMSFILMAIILIVVSVYMRKAGTEELV
ncbi:ABC transporter permease [Streptomyces sp. HNM0575]|uniref:ABC transporter permease subunit n=1 Tax=Streptomyces sp. HNM0575 TaxID=2716338 RepID=UPI00145EBB3E|nr:ABC transporter permease [Streptomyces sp. HNM0575]